MARRGGRISTSSKSYLVSKGNAAKAISAVMKNIQEAVEQVKDGTKEGLNEIAIRIHEASDRYAPKDSNDLVNSSYIASEDSGNKYTVEIGYTAEHSVYQHENYGDSYQDPTTAGTRPKFLQTALNEVERDIENILADAARKAHK